MPMRLAYALVFTLSVVALPAAAQSQVTVHGETKSTVATLRGAQNGDVACYLELDDEQGRRYQEMADFDLCINADQLIGKKVRMHFSVASVMADSCQGDPECKDSQKVALVDRLDPLPQGTATTAASGFCLPAEVEVFGCTVASGKWVNICADRKGKPARLQYRYGMPGKAELQLPAAGSFPDAKVYGRSEAYAGGGAAWLAFRNGDYRYVVYTGIGRWGPNGETRERAGVAVEKSGKTAANIACTTKERSELGPEWFEQAGFDPEGSDEFTIPE
jgi:hypothetical protein